MNLPNKLYRNAGDHDLFFVISLLAFQGEVRLLRNLAAAIFIVASLTDMLDGKIARKYNLVTNLESSWIRWRTSFWSVPHRSVSLNGTASGLMVIIIVSREFIISGFRLIAAEQGIVIAASYWGQNLRPHFR